MEEQYMDQMHSSASKPQNLNQTKHKKEEQSDLNALIFFYHALHVFKDVWLISHRITSLKTQVK